MNSLNSRKDELENELDLARSSYNGSEVGRLEEEIKGLDKKTKIQNTEIELMTSKVDVEKEVKMQELRASLQDRIDTAKATYNGAEVGRLEEEIKEIDKHKKETTTLKSKVDLDKEINIEQLKEGGKELTKIIDEITNLGINGIGTTEEDKSRQIEKFLKQTENKGISDEYREKIELFIKKGLDKMYLIKNTYLEGGKIPPEKAQNLICDIMGITEEKAKEELNKFIKDSGSQIKVELKGPSLIFYIPYIKRFLGKKSAYGFSIIETQGAINNKTDYEKVANKYLHVGGVKCKDEQIRFDDLKGSVILLNANKGQFKSTKDVEDHEYQHVLNQGYLMPSSLNKNLQKTMDEVLAKMSREDLTNELGLYNYFLEDIKKEKKYNKSASLQEVLNNLKQNPKEYKQYQEDRDQHKKNVDKYYNYFTKTMENTGLDRKIIANMLGVQPLENREKIAKLAT